MDHVQGNGQGSMIPGYPGSGSPLRAGQPDPQQLVDLLVEKTGQPRDKVEVWVTTLMKMMQGSISAYDLSRQAGNYIAKQAKEARPFLERFGRSLLHNFIEEQRRLRELEKLQLEIRSTIPQRARSSGLTKARRKSRQWHSGNSRRKSKRVNSLLGDSLRGDLLSSPYFASSNPWLSPEVLSKKPIKADS